MDKVPLGFFSLIQGLIICCLRFELQIQAGNFVEAGIELETASALMIGSAVAMEMAGSYSTDTYKAEVRSSMPDRFSGIMSQDHSFLIAIWKKLHPWFTSMPEVLRHQHEQFISSYKILSGSHKAVCARFGGNEEGSLLSPGCKASEMLARFEVSRLRILNVQSDRASRGENLLLLDKKQFIELSFRSYSNLLMRVLSSGERTWNVSRCFSVYPERT